MIPRTHTRVLKSIPKVDLMINPMIDSKIDSKIEPKLVLGNNTNNVLRIVLPNNLENVPP